MNKTAAANTVAPRTLPRVIDRVTTRAVGPDTQISCMKFSSVIADHFKEHLPPNI